MQPYMKLWTRDFLGDTLHLTQAQVGQYLLLLMAMWNNGGSLPNDAGLIRRICRGPCSSIVLSFFYQVDSGKTLRQKRLGVEVDLCLERQAKARNAANRRWLKHKTNGHALASPKQCLDDAYHSHSHYINTSPNKIEAKEEGILSGNSFKISARDHLLRVLDEEHTEALLDHRRRLKASLGARAGKMLAKRLAEFPDPNKAADTMMERGWRTIHVDWDGVRELRRKEAVGPRKTYREFLAERTK